MQGASLVHTILYSNTVHTLRLYLLSSPGGPGRGKPPLDFNHDCIQNIQIQIDEAADISQGERERNSRLNSEKRLSTLLPVRARGGGEKAWNVRPWNQILVTSLRYTVLRNPILVIEYDYMASEIGVTPSRFREIASGNLQLDGGSSISRINLQ